MCFRRQDIGGILYLIFLKNVVMDGIILSLSCPAIFQMALRVFAFWWGSSPNDVLSEGSASQRSQDFNSFPDSFDLPCLRWSEWDYGASAAPPTAAWAWHCVLFPPQVSIAVGLAGFACVLLLVLFVLINKYGRRSKFGMKGKSLQIVRQAERQARTSLRFIPLFLCTFLPQLRHCG